MGTDTPAWRKQTYRDFQIDVWEFGTRTHSPQINLARTYPSPSKMGIGALLCRV
jgi:hypothetical protein